MTAINVGAFLTSVIVVKGSVIALGALLLAKRSAQTAARSSMILSFAFAAMIAAPWLSGLVPSVNKGFVSLSHGAVQAIPIGPLSASPVLILVGIWGLGAVVLLGRLLNDLRAAWGLVRRAQRAKRKAQSGRVDMLLSQAAAAVGSTRVPQIHVTSELATVALIGFRRPVLLIPVQAREWSDEELFAILCHELEHVRRGDWMMLMLERIVAALYWPNPLIHLARRAAAATRELAADDAALRSGATVEAYAERLIAVARDLRTAPRLAVSVAFAAGGGVDRRVRALFEARDRRRIAPVTVLRAALVALPLVVALAAVEPWICLPGVTPSTSACP